MIHFFSFLLFIYFLNIYFLFISIFLSFSLKVTLLSPSFSSIMWDFIFICVNLWSILFYCYFVLLNPYNSFLGQSFSMRFTRIFELVEEEDIISHSNWHWNLTYPENFHFIRKYIIFYLIFTQNSLYLNKI